MPASLARADPAPATARLEALFESGSRPVVEVAAEDDVERWVPPRDWLDADVPAWSEPPAGPQRLPGRSGLRSRWRGGPGAVWRPAPRAAAAALVAAVLAVGVVAGFVWMRPGSGSTTDLAATPANAAGDLPRDDPSALPSATSGGGMGVASTATTVTASLVVDVAGHVRHPGLVTLPPGSRVADALAAAGGPTSVADVASLDLAARVIDGELLLIGVPGGGGTGSAGATSDAAGGAPLDLNSATVSQLDALPGVGPVLAQHIVDYRTAHGSFHDVSELAKVPGIGPRKYDEIKGLVTV